MRPPFRHLPRTICVPASFRQKSGLKTWPLMVWTFRYAFPILFIRFCGQRFLQGEDKQLALLCVQAYNDWLLEEWAGQSDGHLFGAMLIPLWDPEAAASEVRRNAARGCKAVCFSEIPYRLGLPSMYSGEWDPFFAACEETDMVIMIHIGSSSTIPQTSPDSPSVVRFANEFGHSSLSLTDWILSGQFDKYPRLRIAFAEGQAGWIPFIATRLDNVWHKWKRSFVPAGADAPLLKNPPAATFETMYIHSSLMIVRSSPISTSSGRKTCASRRTIPIPTAAGLSRARRPAH